VDETTRHKVCRLIAGLVVVDDELDQAEDTLIDNMLVKFGLSPDQRESLFPIIDAAEAAEELKTLPADVQQETFQLLIEAAAADKRYAKEEREYLGKVGRVIGLSDEEIAKRVDAALK